MKHRVSGFNRQMVRRLGLVVCVAGLSFAACADQKLISSEEIADFRYKAVFTVTKDVEGATTSAMPVLVKLSESSPAGFSYVDCDPAKILFTDGDMYALPFEVDSWNPQGESLVWVKTPLAKDTVINLFYGSDTTPENDPSSVWSGYTGVWHLNELTAETDSSLEQSQGVYANSTDASGIDGHLSVNSLAHEEGRFGKAFKVNNLTARSAAVGPGGVWVADSGASSPLDADGCFTISGWFKHQDWAFWWDHLFYKRYNSGNSTAPTGAFAIEINSTGENPALAARGSSDKYTSQTFQKTLRAWTYLTFVYDNTTCSIYQDGVKLAWTVIDKAEDNDAPLVFGNNTAIASATSGDAAWQGWIDEVRYLKEAKSDEWIAAEYEAMTSDTLLSASAVQPLVDAVASPVFAPDASELFYPTVSVTISCATEGASIYYTLDGTDPTEADTLYSGAFTLSETTTVKARAYKTDKVASPVITTTYRYNDGEIEHVWGGVEYIWSVDNRSCTAHATCTFDATHVTNTTVTTTYQETKPATLSETGTAVYTATFDGDLFETQTKEVTIPVLPNPGSLGDFRYMVSFTVTKDVAGATDAAMPVLVKLVENAPIGFSYADCDPSSMGFFDADLTQLPFEVDTWNPQGESLVWVKSKLAQDTVIWLCYGGTPAEANDPSAVWEGYTGVWHLNGLATDTTEHSQGLYSNSTAVVGIDGHLAETYSTAGEAGKFGQAVLVNDATAAQSGNFNQGGVFVNDAGADSPVDGGQNFTISGWFKHKDVAYYYDHIFYKRETSGYSGTVTAFAVECNVKTGKIASPIVRGSGDTGSTTSLSDNLIESWGYLTFAFNGTKCNVYENGVHKGQISIAACVDNDSALVFGNNCNIANGETGDCAWNGWIDEVRYSKGTRTSEWIAAEYEAMTSDSLLAAGAVQLIREAAANPVFDPVSGSTFYPTLNVTLTCATEGATIYYTTDGTLPTEESPRYSAPITLDGSATIKAIAVKDGIASSSIVSASYTYEVPPPEGSIVPGATAAETTKTLQDAIDEAANQSPAGTVLLAAGLFEIDEQLMVTGGVKLVGLGWERTIIKQTATSGLDKRVMTIDNGSTVERVTLTGGLLKQVTSLGPNWKNGAGADLRDGTISWCCISNNASLAGNCNYGGGVIASKGTIDHTIIANNRVTAETGKSANGGGLAIRNPSGAVTIDTCLIYGNSVVNNEHAGQGGGICIETLTKAVTICNTTIVGNTAGDSAATTAAQGGAVCSTGDTKWLTMVNCLIANNVAAGEGETMSLSYSDGVDYCLFDSEADKLGAHSLAGDPKFADAERLDYHLTTGSPAIDSGAVEAPTWTDLDEVVYTGVRSIGCYGYGVPLAMVSLTVPAQANMSVLGVSYDGKQAVCDEQGAWLVPAGATVTVDFVAATGYELTGNPVQMILGDDESQTLTTFPTATKIVLPTDDVKLTKVAEYEFAIDGCGGIAYSGADNLFYVLRDHEDDGDKKSKVYPLTLGIDMDTAAVTSQTLGTAFTPGDNADSEGIVYDSASGKLWISDEYGPTITEFGLDGVASGRTAPIPDIIRAKVREGTSLESLALSPDGLTMWTANEEALSCDGERSSKTVQTVVRLTKFIRATAEGNWVAAGQWAYACDTCMSSLVTEYQQCGVSGLCALPDGSLLVLEREVSTTTLGRCRIYRVTPLALEKATEVSAITSLADTPCSAVMKGDALVEITGTAKSLTSYDIIVYEGITLGPRLNDGSYSVYLVSDGGNSVEKTKLGMTLTATTVNRICALKLSGLPGDEPADWPVDPDTEITDTTKPADLAITSGAFSSEDTTPAELRKLAKWAKANQVPYGGTEVNGMAFDANGNPQTDFEKAYLLNCAPAAVADTEALFRFNSITPGVEPVIEGSFNGVVTVLGAETLAGPWTAHNTLAHFYKAILTR